MTAQEKPDPPRGLVPEITLIVVGIVLVVAAIVTSIGWMIISGGLIFLIGVLAAAITPGLSRTSSRIQSVFLIVGAGVASASAVYALSREDSPDIFSPALLFYPAAAVTVSAAATLAARAVHRSRSTTTRSPGRH